MAVPLFLLAAVLSLGIKSADDVSTISCQAIPDSLGNPGGGVRIEWSQPTYDEDDGLFSCSPRKTHPDHYNIYADGKKIGTTTDLFYCVYTPCRIITVTAVLGDDESDGMSISVEPTAAFTLEVWEINGPGSSGITFYPVTMSISTCSMADSSNRDKVDCYFTNYQHGYAESPYYLASASEVPKDTGITWLPETGWRVTGISEALGTYIEDVEIAPWTGYEKSREVATGEVYAIWTQDDCYGLIEVTSISPAYGMVEIRATLQPVSGLRWMVSE